MCGIIGFVGREPADTVLLDGLSRLEYRGYDSAGIAVLENGSFFLLKTDKRIEALKELYRNSKKTGGFIGIGHTRWATHGAPSVCNAHPHISFDGKIAVVHNGIIENYSILKERLEGEGVVFKSETDSEVIPNLIAKYYKGDLLSATKDAIQELEGSYALCIMSTDEPDKIVAVKQFSPLIVGLSDEGNFLSSDIVAFINKTNKVLYPEDNELVLVTQNKVSVYSLDKTHLQKSIHTVKTDKSLAEKGGFDHFMLKEIMEQPYALERTIESRITNEELCFNELNLSEEKIRKWKKIDLIACGSAYHAGVAAKYLLERLTRLPCKVELASEYRYKNPITDENTLTIAISQSGETADTLAAITEAKTKGSFVLSVVNVVGSSIATASDAVVYTHAGPEISVATTKGYTTQLAILFLFAIWLAKALNSTNETLLNTLLAELRSIPERIESALETAEDIKPLAKKLKDRSSLFFIGRNVDYAVALEGSLKLKEISYVHSEAYAAGELKHGTISLVEEGTPIIALAGFKPLRQKLISNIREVKARGGFVISFTTSDDTETPKASDQTFFLPSVHELLCPITEIIPLQLLAYYVSVYKGLDVDKPRNLAKSVTVE